jgi:nicotinamide mononucleotide (NMN) deamidase PncC
VAGPETLEGKAAGTVVVGYSIDGAFGARDLNFPAHLTPRGIREASVDAALETLLRSLSTPVIT